MKGVTMRTRRKQLGMTQQELASAIGTHKNTIARYERNELMIPEPVARLLAFIQPKSRKG